MTGASVPTLTLDSRISLHPLSRQCENGVVVIGRGDQFLEMPPEGLQFLDWLNEGLTLYEARQRFEDAYDAFPDEDLLEVVDNFLECGFVAEIDGQTLTSGRAPLSATAAWFPQAWAQALFSKPTLIFWGLFCVPAVALWIFTPDLWPRPAHYFWIDYFFIILLVDIFLGLFTISSHEMSHWLACRAKGIDATITWTQRIGFLLMSQAVMHNIWAVPRRARFLPLAAGMMWDVLVLSAVLYVLILTKAGLLAIPNLGIRFLQYHLLALVLGLMSQFWLFSKMDGYFLVSSLIGQRNLQGDTFRWLWSKLKRTARFVPPAAGMKHIYTYALIMLVGGGLFLGQFLLVELPIKIHMLWVSFIKMINGSTISPVDFADGVAVLASQTIYWLLLIYVYWRDTLPGLRQI